MEDAVHHEGGGKKGDWLTRGGSAMIDLSLSAKPKQYNRAYHDPEDKGVRILCRFTGYDNEWLPEWHGGILVHLREEQSIIYQQTSMRY